MATVLWGEEPDERDYPAAAGYLALIAPDAQISEILRRRAPEHIEFEAPDLEKVLEIVNRRAPATTLRRKAASRKLRK